VIIPKEVCSAVFGAAILLGFPVGFVAAYYMVRTISNVRPEMKWRYHLMGSLSLFIPLFFTEAGNRYRRRLGLWTLCFLLLWSMAWSITFPCGWWQ
jgi:hypothetical protein